MNRTLSVKAYEEAVQYIPGGVNSPVRALRYVEESPLFIRKARGATLTDVDGNRLTDYCLSWGVFILGHAHQAVNRAVYKAVSNGTSYGIPSLPETELAVLVNLCFPVVEKVRFVNSGTEAVMSAIRLARGFTGRNILVKFDGCYHGHADHLLVSAGSGAARLSGSSSAGVPDCFTSCTVSLPFNDMETVKRFFRERGTEVAAVIVEPVPANMGVVLPQNDFLEFLREITRQYGALLIFDEVITGFRLSAGGSQQLFGIRPDLITLGKILGGGFPAAAFGGPAEIMDLLAPDGTVYQAGTLSGNPVAMSAGIATVKHLLSEKRFYEELDDRALAFFVALNEAIVGKDIVLNHIGSMFTLFFSSGPVNHFADACQTDQQRFGKFFRYMLANGIYLSPSPFEANFLSIAHTTDELDYFVHTVRQFKD
ncbi:MAG: glutamate-1-semialdehyde 2,1-aminomutase [Bacteroidales bacterium]|jgi:glutamate-1-semialdehyde 2,1-aminomutase|nr:glutamate-1-semialdehyde 2,1-aminomutase [Bacteroidales bacterium]